MLQLDPIWLISATCQKLLTICDKNKREWEFCKVPHSRVRNNLEVVAQTPKSNNLKKKMHQFEKYVQEK